MIRANTDRPLDGSAVRAAASDLLVALGYDVTRDGLASTPDRMVRFWQEVGLGQPFEFTTFDNDGTDEMIIETGIPFYSICEHHMVPFFGTAAVGYLPKKRIVGLSKLARAVRHFSAGLQNQERITKAVADLMAQELDPLGIGVVLRARHLCMEMRGVKVPGVETVTSYTWGAMRDDKSTRAEFLKLANERR